MCYCVWAYGAGGFASRPKNIALCSGLPLAERELNTFGENQNHREYTILLSQIIIYKKSRVRKGLGTSSVLQCSAGLIGSGFPCKVA